MTSAKNCLHRTLDFLTKNKFDNFVYTFNILTNKTKSSWSFPTKLGNFNSLHSIFCFWRQYAFSVWAISFACLHKQSLYGVWSKFWSLKKLEQKKLGSRKCISRLSFVVSMSTQDTFNLPSPSLLSIHFRTHFWPFFHISLNPTHILLMDIINWWPLRLLMNMLPCWQLHCCTQDLMYLLMFKYFWKRYFPESRDLTTKVNLLSGIRGVTSIVGNCKHVLEKNLYVDPSNISDSTILTKSTHNQLFNNTEQINSQPK